MNEAKHTPGPWEESVNVNTGKDWLILRENGGDAIALIFDCDDPMETVANIRLIAAAPDLLAAAKDVLDAAMLSDWHLGNDGEWLPDCKALRDAVDQAREIA